MSEGATPKRAERPAPSRPTERELEILKIVWELENATVRQVYERLRKSRRKVAYTTVMTLMKILQEKGHLARSTAGRAYVYTPTRPRSEVISGMVREFVDRVFNGASSPLVMTLVRDRHLSEEELARIAETIREEKT